VHFFLGAVAQIERHLVLRIGFSVSNEEKPCYSVWKSPSCTWIHQVLFSIPLYLLLCVTPGFSQRAQPANGGLP